MPLYARRGALLLLLGLMGCDKLRSLPGLAPPPAPEPPAAAVALGPWLLEPLPGQMTVAWTTLTPSVGRVWYGTREPDHLATEQGQPVTDHRLVLPSLQPQTQYRYRVEGGTEVAWFTSAPKAAGEGPIHELLYGGNRTNNGDHALVARAAAAERAQLVLHTGGMVASAGEEWLWKVWFQEERDLLTHAPILAAPGGAQGADAGGTFARWFRKPGGPAYRSLEYGPVHVVVLDSSDASAGGGRPGISPTQKAWFDEDLRTVPKDRHVWVVVHHGPFAHPAEADPSREGSEAVREAILQANLIHPVEAVFSGSNPFYERGESAGIRYFVLGAGGAPLEEPDASGEGVKSAARALSYATVQVCGCHASGRVKDITGKVIDAFTLSDCETPCSVPGWAASVAAASVVSAPAQEEGSRKSRRRKGKRRR